ncbi:MAG: TIGR00296 family protein [Candidatus Micrarchaeia archaeon]
MAIPFLPPAPEPELPIGLEEGKYLVRLARDAILLFLREKKILKPENPPKAVLQKRGVFVGLEKAANKELRGLIGYPQPLKELAAGAIECAISAAVSDPRFPSLTEAELSDVIIEVSVLSKPEPLRAASLAELPSAIQIGRDGLLVEHDIYSGLLLPQVAVEKKWSSEEFLSNACDKAGLPKDCWREKEIKLYHFTAQVFRESSPGGDVIQLEFPRRTDPITTGF